MNEYIHTIVSTGLLAASYFVGQHFGEKAGIKLGVGFAMEALVNLGVINDFEVKTEIEEDES